MGTKEPAFLVILLLLAWPGFFKNDQYPQTSKLLRTGMVTRPDFVFLVNCVQITHLEPDIQECEVKWDLGSITTNKASGGDAIPVELFQILKDDAMKVLHSIC